MSELLAPAGNMDAFYAAVSNGADAVSLCDAAIAAGGFDNVSCCVITVKEEGGALCH